jgi:hypothetical protein
VIGMVVRRWHLAVEVGTKCERVERNLGIAY